MERTIRRRRTRGKDGELALEEEGNGIEAATKNPFVRGLTMTTVLHTSKEE